jgi:peptidoglycan/LPS O-acetylase OafA/YrhL
MRNICSRIAPAGLVEMLNVGLTNGAESFGSRSASMGAASSFLQTAVTAQDGSLVYMFPEQRNMASLNYRPAIDGLRAVAVISVILFHLNPIWLPSGFVGVDVFFVISGYLISSIIAKDCEKGSFSLVRFYQRRIARIVPLSIVVALATIALASVIYSAQDFASAGASLTAVALSIANMKFMFQGGYFELLPDAQPFLHYWSLSVEEQFYMIFPVVFLLLFKLPRNYRIAAISALCVLSLVACVALTRYRPVWAFFLLPTRAWELLAGCLLATCTAPGILAAGSYLRRWIPTIGMGMICVSFFIIPSGSDFPGFWALIPVLGTIGVLMPPADGIRNPCEACLSLAPVVLIGRMSYSLYLWHWPVFAMIDYKMIFASEAARFILKIGLSVLAAGLTFVLVENPSRVILNRRECRLFAFGFLVSALLLCVPLGIAIHRENYVNAEARDVGNGGLVFSASNETGSVILMGDSNGSMYGKVMKEICAKRRSKLTVISVAAGDPLPLASGEDSQLWRDSLSVVKKERPDCVVLACNWVSKLGDGKERLLLAIEALTPYVKREIVVLNQPPMLPENANRASIRLGQRAPFHEEEDMRCRRSEMNEFLQRVMSGRGVVVDIASRLLTNDREILFIDEQGRQLYQDRAHLSAVGAEFVRSDLERAVFPANSP